MPFNKLEKKNHFVEKDFLELKDSVEKLIDIIEKYKDMRKDSYKYIDDLKDFLIDINLTLQERNLTDKELTNLHSLGQSYFNTHTDSISQYGVYDKNDLEKTHKVNREISVAVDRLNKIFFKITEKVMYHII